MSPTPAQLEQLAAARDAARDAAAVRALDDPVKLDRAARIVRAALARQKLTLAELVPDDQQAAS